MGYSKFSLFFYNKTPATMCSYEKDNIWKCLVQSGLIKTRASVNSFLIFKNEFLASRFHFISFSFLSMLLMHFMISKKFEINLLRKLTLPIKDCTSFFVLGMSIFSIASTLQGSIFIPSLEIICPSNFPSYKEKLYLFGFKDTPNFLHFWKTCSKCFK